MTFRILMYCVGLIVTTICLAMFLYGYGAQAVVLSFVSGAALGFFIGTHDEDEEDGPEEEQAAPEGANVVSLRRAGR